MYPVFVATSAANVGTCILKDRSFTRMFAKPGELPKPIPLTTYSLFCARDCLTIWASFTIVPFVAGWIYCYANTGVKINTNTSGGAPGIITSARGSSAEKVSGATATALSQLFCPMAIQTVSTPLHLLALDLYNNPTRTMSERGKFIKTEYFKTVAARCMRILPAFGFGGIGNRYIRGKLNEVN